MLRVTLKDDTQEYVPESQKDQASPGAFIYRRLKRREYTRILRALGNQAESSGLAMDLDAAYEIARSVLQSVRNVQDEDGKPYQIQHDANGVVTEESIDAFRPADVFQFALHIVRSSQLGVDEGGK